MTPMRARNGKLLAALFVLAALAGVIAYPLIDSAINSEPVSDLYATFSPSPLPSEEIQGLLQTSYEQALAELPQEYPKRWAKLAGGEVRRGTALGRYAIGRGDDLRDVWGAIEQAPFEYQVPILVDGRLRFLYHLDMVTKSYAGVEAVSSWPERAATRRVEAILGAGCTVKVVYDAAVGRSRNGRLAVSFFYSLGGAYASEEKGQMAACLRVGEVYVGAHAVRILRTFYRPEEE